MTTDEEGDADGEPVSAFVTGAGSAFLSQNVKIDTIAITTGKMSRVGFLIVYQIYKNFQDRKTY
jgi:hypothetical protein